MSDMNKYTFWELIQDSIIEIPIIQRDYAQGRDDKKANRIRKDLVEKLHKVVEENDKPINLDFVYGSIVDEKMIPLDGQQRLTTLYLLHWYLAFKDGKLSEVKDNLLKFTYETRVSSREFCENLVKSDFTLEIINVKKLSDIIKDKSWFFNSWLKDPTIKAMLNMIDALHDKFKDTKGLFEKLISENNQLITFDFLELKQFNLTDELYVKMNARGKPLTEFEYFKAKLIELLDCNESIQNLDNKWTDLFWVYKDNVKTENGYYDIDILFLRFFERLTISFGLEDGSLRDEKKLDGINILDKLEIVYKEKDNRITLAIVLDKLCDLEREKQKQYFDNFILKETINAWDRAKFYAYNLFLINGNDSYFDDWIRVSTNIIDSYNIDKTSKLHDTIKAMKILSENKCNIYKNLINFNFKNEDIASTRNLAFHIKEEKIKAKLINSDEWKNVLIGEDKTESHWYLHGQISFLLEFSKDEKNNYNLEKFKKYYQKFNEIFKEDRENFEFQRALLTKGNYLVKKGYNKTFCSFNDSPREKDDNWRQVFYDDKSEILKKLLDDLIDNSNTLDKIINNFTDNIDWRYNFIKYPCVLSYCKKYQIRTVDYNNILLLSGERIYGEHAEYYSYVNYCSNTTNNNGYEYIYAPKSKEAHLLINGKKWNISCDPL